MKRLFNSFRVAFKGIHHTYQSEPNFKIHIIIGLLVIVAGFVLEVSKLEFVCLLIMIGTVLSAEMINTSIEEVMNFVSPEYHEKTKKIKDISAGAVLILALTSVVVGLIIFFPKILSLLS